MDCRDLKLDVRNLEKSKRQIGRGQWQDAAKETESKRSIRSKINGSGEEK